MFFSTHEMYGYRLQATDGEFGRVTDIYFDDAEWGVRYLVADTGRWLPGQKVLISPVAVGPPDGSQEAIPVNLTKSEIELGPSIGEHEPVSRQHEHKLMEYFGWPAYWGGLGPYPAAGVLSTQEPPADHMSSEGARRDKEQVKTDAHLRSAREVEGYRIQASDGEIGHMERFVVDTEDWYIKFLVVDTRNWLPGRKVLLAPDWCSGIDWIERLAEVHLTQEQIRNSPEYEGNEPIDPHLVDRLYEYYREWSMAKA